MGQPEYIHAKTIKTNNIIARIFSPVLTEEERNRRHSQIKKAAENLVKSALMQKAN